MGEEYVKVCTWCKKECDESHLECPDCDGPLGYPDWVYEDILEDKGKLPETEEVEEEVEEE